jgi:signal transduction histidine kinase
MIKTFAITLIFISSCSVTHAQVNYIDSLQNVLSNTVKPVERFNILRNILTYKFDIQANNVDSAASIELFQIAQQLKNDSVLEISYRWIGAYFIVTRGDNAIALEFYFKALALAEKMKDKLAICSIDFAISIAYFQLQNNEEAVSYVRKGGANLPDLSSPDYDQYLVLYQRGLSIYYLLTHRPDSSLHYGQGMYATGVRIKNVLHRYNAFALIAPSYEQLGEKEKAEIYFRKAIAIADSVNATVVKLRFYNNYIPFLLNSKRIREAHEQVKQLLNLATQNNNNTAKLAAAGFMRQVFDSLHNKDSAYYYSRMEADINAQIFNQSNTNKIQGLAFNKRLRDIEEEAKQAAYQSKLKQYGMLTGLVVFLLIGLLLYRNNRQKQKANKVLETTLTNLKSTQSQLIQSEKMASLGELTAGIAHEIQNPLNFVNNFSEVNKEMLEELKAERLKSTSERDENLQNELINDVIANEEKINHHGKRADAIVKNMLQHSRASSGKKEPTGINALCDEYLRLAYHGLRAKDKSFNATMKTDFDESIGNINTIPQDIGRVILNLINNAFYAVDEKKKQIGDGYEPTVSVSTKKNNARVEIKVADNGNGIPQKVLDKIFQPFFTTKPTGQGTGLGLSLSYDIVKAHGGELKVETKEGKGSVFNIQLPL